MIDGNNLEEEKLENKIAVHTMDLYNLTGSSINCHHSNPGGNRSIEKLIDGENRSCWSTD